MEREKEREGEKSFVDDPAGRCVGRQTGGSGCQGYSQEMVRQELHKKIGPTMARNVIQL